MMLWGRSGAGVHGGGTDERRHGWRSEGEGPSWNDAGLHVCRGRALLQPGHPLLNGFQSQQAHRPQRRPCGERRKETGQPVLLGALLGQAWERRHKLALFHRGVN